MSNEVRNEGSNSGIVLGENHGTINLSLKNVNKVFSLINAIIELLAEQNFCNDDDKKLDTLSFDITNKIQYNQLIKYKDIIKEYSIYSTYCEEALSKYDNSHINDKNKILMYIRKCYLEAKGELLLQNKNSELSEMVIIRDNSDFIMDKVKDAIFNIWNQSIHSSSVSIEEVELAVIFFITYCFIICKILEKPDDN